MDSYPSDQRVKELKVSEISMLISAISMGCVGLFVTLLSKYPIYTIVLLRGIFGSIFLTLFMIRKRSFSKSFLKKSFKTHWKPLLIIGLINPLVIYFYFITINTSGYAIAAFLLYTGGIFFIFFVMITKTEHISKITILSFALAIAGVAIIMEFWTEQGQYIGLFTGLLSGLTLGTLTFYKKRIYVKRKTMEFKLEERGDFDMFLAWFPTLFLVVLFLPLGGSDLGRLTTLDLIYAILLGLIPTAIAFTLYNVGVKNDKGGNIVILSYFEPIIAMINTIIFLGALSIFTIIGGAFIVVANVIILKFSK